MARRRRARRKSSARCKCKGVGKRRRCWRHVRGQIRGCKRRR